MRILDTLGAQGEVRCFRIDALPQDTNPLNKENGKYIIGHSETGHHHVLEAERLQVFQDINPPAGMNVFYAILESAGSLQHLRTYDTHAAHHFEPGIYMFRTDREYDPYTNRARGILD